MGMGLGVRRFVLACVVAASALAVLVPGGSAGPRAVNFTFEAVPGPGAVTYKENISYRVKISNTSGTTLAHVIFRMRKPFVGDDPAHPVAEATFNNESTCPQNGGKGVTVTNADGTVEWTCDFGNLPAWNKDPATDPQKTMEVVWQVPELAQADDCNGCLKAPARLTVKEGLNDQTNPNDLFLPDNPQIPATLLSADTKDVKSTNTKSAGGYETKACTNVSGGGSLQTNQNLNAVTNKVSTFVCISFIPSNSSNLGLATTILEGFLHPENPGFPELETSDLCIAQLGTNCGVFGQYTPQQFLPNQPITVVLRFPEKALENGHKITKIWHNYNALTNPNPLPLCTSGSIPVNGCLDGLPFLDGKGNDKFYRATVQTLTNGWFGGG